MVTGKLPPRCCDTANFEILYAQNTANDPVLSQKVRHCADLPVTSHWLPGPTSSQLQCAAVKRVGKRSKPANL